MTLQEQILFNNAITAAAHVFKTRLAPLTIDNDEIRLLLKEVLTDLRSHLLLGVPE